MSIEKIIEQINNDAKQKAQEILNEANQKAWQIKNKAKDEARTQKVTILEQAKKDVSEREKRMLQMKHLSGRKAILTEKQKAIQLIFNAALNHLAGLNPGKYKYIIRHMLLKAVKSGREEIILSPKDRKILDEEWLKGINKEIIKHKGVPGELRFSNETRQMKGGFVLRDGQVEINNSFEAIIKYNKNELETQIVTMLLGK